MMQAMATHEQTNGATGREQAPEYLECLQALARELESAMQSIAANGHPSFEESVSRQLVLCSRLTTLAARHQSRRKDAPLEAAPSAGDDLSARIEDAKVKLLNLNRNYSALLNHTRRTVQMFAGLARCYSGYAHPLATTTPGRTWSSEL
jgi:hypothetical protein